MANRHAETDLSEVGVSGDHVDELFDVLSDPRRRFILSTLQTAETPVELAEVTTELADWEAQRSKSDRSRDDHDSIELSLVHSHLPKMAEAGLIRFDETQRTVTLADRAAEVQPYLQA